MKTLSSLNIKSWYRFLKVLYVLVVIATVIIIYNTYRPQYDSFIADIVEPLLWVLFILEIFKRSIYYTYLGTISPKKVEMNFYVTNIKKSIAQFNSDTTDFPESTKRFLVDVFRVAQIVVEDFEKEDSKKDCEKLLKLNNLVTESNRLYRTGQVEFSALNRVKVSALYHAQDMGMNIDWVSIDL